MKKLFGPILILSMTAVMTVSAAAAVYADGGNVTYTGHADKFIFDAGSSYTLTDLFDSNTKGVMPGATVSETIHVGNVSGGTVRIYLRSLGAAEGEYASKEGSAEFLSRLTLSVDGLTDDAASAGGLREWRLLGTLGEGEERDLDIMLRIPVSLDNEYMDRIGYIKWQFAVTDVNGEDADPGRGDSVITGDNTDLRLFLITGLGAAAALAALTAAGRREG